MLSTIVEVGGSILGAVSMLDHWAKQIIEIAFVESARY